MDDSKDWRRFVSLTVQRQPGWHVVREASDGLEAIQKAQELQPDLILLDIGLPKLNGIEAARKIRKLAPNSTILFLSANDSLDIAEEALNTGARGYVVKRDAGSELISAVEAIIRGERFVSKSLKGRISVDAEDAHSSDNLHRNEILASPAPTVPRKTEITRCHEAQFYSDDASFLDGFSHFIGAALKAGKTTIVVATESHRDSLLPKLQGLGLDMAAAIGERRFISLDAADTLSKFMINDQPDPVRFFKVVGDLMVSAAQAAKGEHPRIAACGECGEFLWAQGKAEAAIREEQLWDETAKKYDVDILCGYSSRSFHREKDSHIFRRICAEHSAVYPL